VALLGVIFGCVFLWVANCTGMRGNYYVQLRSRGQHLRAKAKWQRQSGVDVEAFGFRFDAVFVRSEAGKL